MAVACGDGAGPLLELTSYGKDRLAKETKSSRGGYWMVRISITMGS
jgi:hypothetical protein